MFLKFSYFPIFTEIYAGENFNFAFKRIISLFLTKHVFLVVRDQTLGCIINALGFWEKQFYIFACRKNTSVFGSRFSAVFSFFANFGIIQKFKTHNSGTLLSRKYGNWNWCAKGNHIHPCIHAETSLFRSSAKVF